jgi:fumarate reductase flavoprotein subunit
MKAALERESTDVFAADSLEELALKIDVDPTVLAATVDEYNGFCAKGYDDLFAKDPRYLQPLRGPVYYAIKVRTVFLGTKGGIKINENMEVVDKKGNVIPGLYAGGFDAGGAWGDSYPIMHCSGASSAFAINSGRIAAKNALEYMGI